VRLLKIELLAAGTKPPDWVAVGFQEYQKRLPPDWQLTLSEIRVSKRHKGEPVQKLKKEEGKRMLALVKPGSLLIAMDSRGSSWSTRSLARKLQDWQQRLGQVQLMVGGPDGLSDECLKATGTMWSLSKLTFPHFIVRLLIAEQVYRAWSILNNHPYHK
jgi:23S rRNA (pseudouridine1915-N3)-methyltransferase